MKNVLILGCGRSGTSLAAGLFSSTRCSYGGVPYPARDSNPKGFFETHEVNGVNERLLATALPRHPRLRAGQRWLAECALDARFTVEDDVLGWMQRLAARTPFVFKDPRLCYTLPAWRLVLTADAEAAHLCVFRDPSATAASIVRECATQEYLKDVHMSYERALAVWTSMYTHVLQRHASIGDWRFVHYEQLFESETQAALAEWTGARLDTRFPDRRFDRTTSERPVTDDAAQLYRELCQRASFAPQRLPHVVVPRAPAPASDAAAQPEFSVILCTYNRREILAQSLASFARQRAAAGSFELVVVNDGSTDGTREFLDGLVPSGVPTRILHRENGGLSAARNTGIAAARGKRLLFVNDDTIAFPDLIEQHGAAHARAARPVAVLGTFEQPLAALDGALMRTIEASGLVFRYSDMCSGEEYDANRFWTCNISVDADAVRAVGGFDESFRRYGAEDIDLGIRLAQRGIPVVYDASARARHEHVLDFDQFRRRQVVCARSFVRLFRKHPHWLDHADWTWVRSRALADLDTYVAHQHARVPELEQRARALSSIDLGALDGAHAPLVGSVLRELATLLDELNRVYWMQGLADGLREFGLASFGALRPAANAGPFAARQVRTPRSSELERMRDLARHGESVLATASAIRFLASVSEALTATRDTHDEVLSQLYADGLSDLSVLRFTDGDHDGSLACVDEALRVCPQHELARANRADVLAAAQRRKPRWADTPEGGLSGPTELSPWVAQALEIAEQRVGLRGRDVVEIGGAIPESAARKTGARRWASGYLEAEPYASDFYQRGRVDCRELPYADASFDVAFSSAAFEHVHELDRAFAEIRRVLRPGGALVTNFAPIWSCAVGHHLWSTDGAGRRIMFMDPVIPLWGHLLLAEEELRWYLALVIGAEAAAHATQYVYHHPCLNRVFEGEFQRVFERAGFAEVDMQRQPVWGSDHVPSALLAEELERLHPGGGDFATPGFRGVMRSEARVLATSARGGAR
ncbi:MAG: glycosyltransferase [Planctomycetota bacterium]